MDLETALTSLYAASREDFIPDRDEATKQARAAGDRELAKKIAAARKPTVAAWLLNQVSREYPDDLAALGELSEQLRGAHQELAADKLRALSQRRNEALRTLDDRALRVARRAKMSVTAQVTEALREAFTAALLDPDVLATLRAGRLSAVPGAEASTGWPTWDGIPATTAPTTAPTTAKAAPPKSSPSPKSTKDDQAERRRIEERRARRAAQRAEAEEEASLAEAARVEAEVALDAARQRSEEADAELAAARNRVEQARFEQRTAKLAAATAQHEYDQAERNARAAQRALTDLS
ncbi:MAG TPA: hypothetical protein VJ914_01980 [Pseudonocardiaceae bacterium]|nr:hypothetical protein [Pseudonocardiaceae bacterium]